jgi:hypothetical protein
MVIGGICMRLNLLPVLLAAGVLIASEPYEAVAAPVTTAAGRISPTVAGDSIDKIYYYHGHYYPYYYRGGYYPYRYGGQYYRHRYYRSGRWHY